MNMLLLTSLLLAQTVNNSVDDLPLGAIPRQDLPKTGCAAYLWSKTENPALIAMASADPAQIRLSLGGSITDLARDTQQGTGGLGFAATTTYKRDTTTVALTMTIAPRDDLKQGAAVPEGTLRLDRDGQDSVVVPVAGLIGCAS